MHRRQVMDARRPCGSNLSPWEQMEWRPLYKGSKGKWEQKDEGIVKMNKSKAESVRSWCHQRQTGSVKAHQRVVWSLIFIVSGVHLVKAEVQEDQAREVHPDRWDDLLGMRKEMMIWEDW